MKIKKHKYICPQCGAENQRLIDLEDDVFTKDGNYGPIATLCAKCHQVVKVPCPVKPEK